VDEIIQDIQDIFDTDTHDNRSHDPTPPFATQDLTTTYGSPNHDTFGNIVQGPTTLAGNGNIYNNMATIVPLESFSEASLAALLAAPSPVATPSLSNNSPAPNTNTTSTSPAPNTNTTNIIHAPTAALTSGLVTINIKSNQTAPATLNNSDQASQATLDSPGRVPTLTSRICPTPTTTNISEISGLHFSQASTAALASSQVPFYINYNRTSPATLDRSGQASPATSDRSGPASATLDRSGQASPATLDISGKASPATLDISGKASPATLVNSGQASPATLNISGQASPASLNISGQASPAKFPSPGQVTSLTSSFSSTPTTTNASEYGLVNKTMKTASSIIKKKVIEGTKKIDHDNIARGISSLDMENQELKEKIRKAKANERVKRCRERKAQEAKETSTKMTLIRKENQDLEFNISKLEKDASFIWKVLEAHKNYARPEAALQIMKLQLELHQTPGNLF